MGSLMCALASYLDAKKNCGRWLLRIEDIDPPREQKGASQRIINTLIRHGLLWDGEVLYQSSRSDTYRQTLKQLRDSGLSYLCTCTRRRLRTLNVAYDNHCRQKQVKSEEESAIRLNINKASANLQITHSEIFDDCIQGRIEENVESDGDFIIHRKDGLFAYQLAVVVDDITQGISHIIRGVDLLESTAKQRFLTRTLKASPAQYCHIPVLVDAKGCKLSKQACAPAVEDTLAEQNLVRALDYLQLSPGPLLERQSTEKILGWAIERWDAKKLRSLRCVTL